MRIAILDDEDAQTRLLTELARRWAAMSRLPVDVRAYPNAQSFLFDAEGWRADLLLLDIQMPGMDGMQLAHTLRERGEDAHIVFITGIAEHMQRGFDVGALHSLIKPVEERKLFDCLTRANERVAEAPPLLLETTSGEALRLAPARICSAEAFAHSCLVRTPTDAYEVRASIGELMRRLPECEFVRCHRSYVVGIRHMLRVGRDCVTLDGGAQVPLSRRLYRDVNMAFLRFYRKKAEQTEEASR